MRGVGLVAGHPDARPAPARGRRRSRAARWSGRCSARARARTRPRWAAGSATSRRPASGRCRPIRRSARPPTPRWWPRPRGPRRPRSATGTPRRCWPPVDGRSGRAVPVVALIDAAPQRWLVLWTSEASSASVRRRANGTPGRPPTLSRKCPTPGGVLRRAASDGGEDQLVTRWASAAVRSTTRRTSSSSAWGRPPSSSIPARSTNPDALARSAGSGSAARSARLWVIITCPTPWARFRRVSASRRSTMPDPARIARHSSSRTIRKRRCGARPASVSALAASTAPNPSAHTASRAAAWVVASSGTPDTSTARAGLVRSRRVVVGPLNMAPSGESSR